MSAFKIEPKILDAVSTDIPNSLHFLSNEEVLYPAGGVLTIHNIPHNTQTFITVKCDPQKILNFVVVDPEKKFVSVACSAPEPIIEIYSLKKRQLTHRINIPARLISMCYTWDGSHLLYVTLEESPTMYYYSFEQQKVESSTLAIQPPAYLGPVKMVAGNPADSMIVVIVGSGLFRLLNLSDSLWRQYGFQKAENYDFISVCWISAERIIAGTTDGRIILVDSGELKGIYRGYDIDVIVPTTNKEQLQIMTNKTMPKSNAARKSILSVIGFAEGFLLVVAPNIIIVFKKENAMKYVKKNEVISKKVKVKYATHDSIKEEIVSVSVSPDEKVFLCCTFQAQIYKTSLFRKDADETNKEPFVPLSHKFHFGEVKNLSTCVWKPWLMTSGFSDGHVCLFNYEKNKLIFSQYFNNDIHSLAMHPTGLFCVIAFTDVCQIAYIMMDKLVLGKSLSGKQEGEGYSPVRSCNLMEFSSYGTILALADGVQIKLYDYIQFFLLITLVGHRMEITSFKWISNDDILLSCGLDGAVYTWNVKNGKRLVDVVTKNCKHHDIDSISDGKLIYTVGNDGHLKEIKHEAVIQDLEVTNNSMTHLVMARNGQLTIISDEKGLVMVVNYPVVQKVYYTQHCVHVTSVTHMKLNYELTYLITCDKEGMVCLWKILSADGIEITPPENHFRCTDILISEEELSEKQDMIRNLQKRIQESSAEEQFKIKELYKSHNMKLHQLKEQKEKTMQMLNGQIENMKKNNQEEVMSLMLQKKEIEEKCEKDLNAIEQHLKYKLLVRECDRSKKLEQTIKELEIEHDKNIGQLEQSLKKQMQEMEREQDQTIKTLQEELTKTTAQYHQEIQNQDSLKQILEGDADRAIEIMRQKFEKLISDERNRVSNIRRQLSQNKDEINKMNQLSNILKGANEKLQDRIREEDEINCNAEERIQELLKEIVERDKVLIPKEKRVHFMKLKAESLQQELQVLKMKNYQLEKKIQPKDDEIAQLEETMELLKELVSHKEHDLKEMLVQITNLQECINSKSVLLEKEKQKRRELTALLTKMKNEIYDVYETMKDQNHNQLRAATQGLYDKYCKGKSAETLIEELKSMTQERTQQREHLENTIKHLSRQLARERNIRSNRILVQEGTEYQNVNNGLRRLYKQKVDKLEKLKEKLGCDPENATSIKEKVLADTQSNAKVHEECRKRTEELEATNQKLHDKLFELQKNFFEDQRKNMEEKTVNKVESKESDSK